MTLSFSERERVSCNRASSPMTMGTMENTTSEELADGGHGELAAPQNYITTSNPADTIVACIHTADTGKTEKPVQLQKDAFLKTSLCSYFRKTGNCRHGDSCRYAHGEVELRARPDGSWDPTSIMAKVASGKSGIENENGETEATDSLRKCIFELPLSWTSENLNQLLAEKEISFVSSKKRPLSTVGFIEFESDEHLAQAKQKLDGFSVNAKILKIGDTSPHSSGKEHIQDASEHGDNENASENNEKQLHICDVVTPLAKLPYQQQLDKKSMEICQILKKLVRNVRKAISPGVPLPEWATDAKHKAGLSCTFDGIIPSPLIDGYRNKCEFTIGHSHDGKRVVGFLLGNFREGRNIVMEPDQCRNVSEIAKSYAKAFQKFIEGSTLDVWDKKTNSGFWRLFTVREGRESSAISSVRDVMLIVQICSTGVDEDTRSKEYNKMANDLALAASQACPQLSLSALLVQDHLGISNAASLDSPLIPISIPSVENGAVQMGNSHQNSYIHDHINNLRFRISPTSFFQVNSSAAEKLYNLAGDWAGLDSQTLLFDVCCGTGTIGLTLAHRVGMVIGIEMNAAAIADAHINAEINGIKNCKFVCGKAEDVIQDLLDHYLGEDVEESSCLSSCAQSDGEAKQPQSSCAQSDSEVKQCFPKDKDMQDSGLSLESRVLSSSGKRFTSVVVLVDPPRSGLHPVVVKFLRAYERIRRLVYISCNPETLLANAVELCTPIGSADRAKGGSQRGPHRRTVIGNARQRVKSMPASTPFSPVKAVAVDMFPHTPHCEMVMLMER